MNPTDLLAALHTAERLKDTTRHCCTSHQIGRASCRERVCAGV